MIGTIFYVLDYIYIKYSLFQHHDDINYIWVPITLAAAFSFAIAHCFLLVYEVSTVWLSTISGFILLWALHSHLLFLIVFSCSMS